MALTMLCWVDKFTLKVLNLAGIYIYIYIERERERERDFKIFFFFFFFFFFCGWVKRGNLYNN